MNIEQVIDKYGNYVYKYALKLTCDPHKAEDIAQETFISAWKNEDKIIEDKTMRKWLQKVCLNHFLMDYRKAHKNSQMTVESIEELEQEGEPLVANEAGPEEEVIVDDAIRGIQNGCFYAMVRKLTLNQRIAFSLVDMFGLGISDVAELLDISDNAAKALLHRARTNIEHFFAGHCNILDASNPCSCQSWINFRTDHEKNVMAAQEVFTSNESYKPGKHIDDTVRGKIRFLYTHMPESKPDDQWFKNIVLSFKVN